MRADMQGTIENLALGIEGTLISNATSPIARPGLRRFLDFCGETFPRVVIYTSVREEQLRRIARLLVNDESAPDWFEGLEYVSWDGPFKDLCRIRGSEPNQTALLDDDEKYVHPDQRRRWVRVPSFESPYPDDDQELDRVREILRQLAAKPQDRSRPPLAKRMNRKQAAAIPYRHGANGFEVMLITSASTGRWIVPKGNVDPGYSPAEAAVIEAREEAGVEGLSAADPIVVYDTIKGTTPLSMLVFPLRVETVLKDWSESRLRRRRWATLEQALSLLDREWMRAALRRTLEANPGPRL